MTYLQLVLFNPNQGTCADISGERNGKTKSGQCHARYTRERWFKHVCYPLILLQLNQHVTQKIHSYAALEHLTLFCVS